MNISYLCIFTHKYIDIYPYVKKASKSFPQFMLVSDYFFDQIFEEEFLLRASVFNDPGVLLGCTLHPAGSLKQMLVRHKVFFMYFHRQSPNGMLGPTMFRGPAESNCPGGALQFVGGWTLAN